MRLIAVHLLLGKLHILYEPSRRDRKLSLAHELIDLATLLAETIVSGFCLSTVGQLMLQ